tara:strand:- start:1044 stop:1376 length:333 start_codon:yes stop_codon:yes gene_type:complete
MKFSDRYISSICPELGKWEVQLLKNHLLDMHHPNDIYEQQVTVMARSLFPELYRWRAAKKYEAIQEAVELLQRADQILANVVDASDEVARTQLEIRNNVVYLQRENGGES